MWNVDTTLGMNTTGTIHIHLPRMGAFQIGEKKLFWVRVRIKEISRQETERGMRNYIKSPMLRSLTAASWGGTVTATHSQQVKDEYIGRSDGSAGQRFQLQVTPILQRHPDENLILKVDGQPPQVWREVSDFAETGSEDACYTLDGTTGELRFGPAVRQPDGAMKLYGAIPPRGASLFFSCYRYGGGERGNVSAGLLEHPEDIHSICCKGLEPPGSFRRTRCRISGRRHGTRPCLAAFTRSGRQRGRL